MAWGILEQNEQANSTAPFLVAIATFEFEFEFESAFEHNSCSVLNAFAISFRSSSELRCFKRSKQSMTGLALVSPGTHVTMPAKTTAFWI